MDDKFLIEDLKAIVAEAGGVWCGVQEPLGSEQPSLLLFNSPDSGSTLAIPLDQNAVEWSDLVAAICKRIKESDATFADRRISVKASILSDISNRLMRLVEEVDALYLKEKS